ncbi:hypothetical protein HN51_067069 [Arachis hypogaea]
MASISTLIKLRCFYRQPSLCGNLVYSCYFFPQEYPQGMEYVLHGVIALGIMAAGGVLSGGNPASHVLQIKKQGDSADAKLVVTL